MPSPTPNLTSSPADNLLLNSLSGGCLESLLVHAQSVDLPLGAVLHEPGLVPRYAFFLTSGLALVMTSMAEGHTVEVGIIGCQGVVGGLDLLGPGLASTQCFMQIPGSALRIPLSELRVIFLASAEIRGRVLEFVQVQAMTLSQIAGCHRLHGAEQRLARWLLMVHDRVETDSLGLTQEFLAQMLGSQRTTMTKAAATLQRRGLILYSRGHIRILDKPGLELATCDCYAITRQLLQRLYQ